MDLISCFPETKIVSNQFNPSEFEEAGIEIRRRCLVMSGVGGSGLEQEQTKLLEGWHVVAVGEQLLSYSQHLIKLQ